MRRRFVWVPMIALLAIVVSIPLVFNGLSARAAGHRRRTLPSLEPPRQPRSPSRRAGGTPGGACPELAEGPAAVDVFEANAI